MNKIENNLKEDLASCTKMYENLSFQIAQMQGILMAKIESQKAYINKIHEINNKIKQSYYEQNKIQPFRKNCDCNH